MCLGLVMISVHNSKLHFRALSMHTIDCQCKHSNVKIYIHNMLETKSEIQPAFSRDPQMVRFHAATRTVSLKQALHVFTQYNTVTCKLHEVWQLHNLPDA
jgi:hypothetical protein